MFSGPSQSNGIFRFPAAIACQMRIPAAAGHPFRFEPDTYSDFGRTLIPESPDTCSGASGHP